MIEFVEKRHLKVGNIIVKHFCERLWEGNDAWLEEFANVHLDHPEYSFLRVKKEMDEEVVLDKLEVKYTYRPCEEHMFPNGAPYIVKEVSEITDKVVCSFSVLKKEIKQDRDQTFEVYNPDTKYILDATYDDVVWTDDDENKKKYQVVHDVIYIYV